MRLDTVRQQLLEEAEITNVQDKALVQSRREQICDAALELFLEKGFASTTIRDICARSGVNQASIYDYIANKNDILRRLLNRMYSRPESAAIAERRKAGAYASIEDYLQDFFRHTWTTNRESILLTYRVIRDLDPQDRKAVLGRDRRLVNDTAALLRRGMGLSDDDERAAIIANLIVFITAFVPLRDWNLRDFDDDLVLRTVTAGVAAMIRELARDGRASPDGCGNDA